MSEELLAKMTAKGINPAHVGGGAVPELTAQDIAAAAGMAGLDRRPYLLLLLKVCDDRHVWPDLTLLVSQAVAANFKCNGGDWEEPLSDQLKLALFVEEFGRTAVEHVLGHRCKTCGGTGIYRGRVHNACDAGIKNPGSQEMGRRVGVSDKTWLKTWAARHKELVDRLSTEYHDALISLDKYLRRDAA